MRKEQKQERDYKSRGKSTKPYRKEEESLKGCNDSKWYIPNEQLLKDVCSLAFPYANGSPMPFTGAYKSTTTGVYVEIDQLVSNPSFCVVNWVPSIGGKYSGTNGINISANRNYTFVRHANSGHSNYESSDLMMFRLAVASVYAYINQAARVYAIANFATFENRSFPKALVNALGFDFDDVASNLADFRARINLCITRLGGMAVPKEFGLSQRWNYLCSNIFQDANSKKCQLYIPKMQVGWKYDPTSLSTGTCLTYAYADGSVSYKNFFSTLDDMIDALVTDEDCNIMSGDILKAYGSENLMKYSLIPEALPLPITYDEEFLHQLHNADIFYIAGQTTDHPIQQVNNTIVIDRSKFQRADAVVDVVSHSGQSPKYLDVHNEGKEVTATDVLEATRFMLTYEIDTQTHIMKIESSGSEIISGLGLYWFDADPNTIGWRSNFIGYSNFAVLLGIDTTGTHWDLSAPNTALYNINAFTMLTAFDYFPRIVPIFQAGNGTEAVEIVSSYPLWDVDNITTIDQYTLSNIHDMACLGETTPRTTELDYGFKK